MKKSLTGEWYKMIELQPFEDAKRLLSKMLSDGNQTDEHRIQQGLIMLESLIREYRNLILTNRNRSKSVESSWRAYLKNCYKNIHDVGGDPKLIAQLAHNDGFEFKEIVNVLSEIYSITVSEATEIVLESSSSLN